MSAQWTRGKAINDAAGRLFWDGLPNNTAFDLLIEAEGYEPVRRASAITSRDDSDLRIELQPVDVSSLVDVAGTILDRDGLPIKGVDIQLIGLDPALAALDRRGGDIDIQTIRMGYAKDRPACKFARGTVTGANGEFIFPKVSKRLNLQLVYWGKDTPDTRVRDLETRTAVQLGRLEVIAAKAVTVKGRINLAKYPRPGRVLVQGPMDLPMQSAEVAKNDRSMYSVTRLPPGELKISLHSEFTPRRDSGRTSSGAQLLATKTITAKSGETIEVNFD